MNDFKPGDKVKLRRLKDIKCEFDVGREPVFGNDYITAYYHGRRQGLVNPNMEEKLGKEVVIAKPRDSCYYFIVHDSYFAYHRLLFERSAEN